VDLGSCNHLGDSVFHQEIVDVLVDLGSCNHLGELHVLDGGLVELLESATGGLVLLVSSTERADLGLVLSHELLDSSRVLIDERLESLSRVFLERLDLLGVCGLHFFDEFGELLYGSCEGNIVFLQEILDALVELGSFLLSGGLS